MLHLLQSAYTVRGLRRPRGTLGQSKGVILACTQSDLLEEVFAALPEAARGPLAHASLVEETEKLVVVLEPRKPKPPTRLQWQVRRGSRSPFPFEIYRAVVQLDEE